MQNAFHRVANWAVELEQAATLYHLKMCTSPQCSLIKSISNLKVLTDLKMSLIIYQFYNIEETVAASKFIAPSPQKLVVFISVF